MEIKIIETVTTAKETNLIQLLQLEVDVLEQRINKGLESGMVMHIHSCGEKCALERVIKLLQENELVLK